MEMRTTDVRKLKPEAWGFICPVHTPDGAPCGKIYKIYAIFIEKDAIFLIMVYRKSYFSRLSWKNIALYRKTIFFTIFRLKMKFSGLLNHVTASCRIVTDYEDTRDLPSYLTDLGMYSHNAITMAEPDQEVKFYEIF